MNEEETKGHVLAAHLRLLQAGAKPAEVLASLHQFARLAGMREMAQLQQRLTERNAA